MVKKDTYPADINNLLNEVRLGSKRIRAINDKCRKMKEEELFQETSEKVKAAKEALFVYATDNELDKVGDYSIEWLKPPSIKKDERNERKEEKIRDTTKKILPSISDEQLEDLVNKLTV